MSHRIPGLFAFALLLASTTFAQHGGDSTFVRLVHQRCPGADILKVQRASFDLLEVEYICQGRRVELGINNGAVVYEEHEGEPGAEAMERIRRKVDKDFPGWLFDEVSLITAKDSTFVKVEVVKEGVEQNLYFTTEGKAYKPEHLAPQGWTAKELDGGAMADAPFDLLRPDSTYTLPPLLREVSGIAIAGPLRVYGVQDELGAVFEYDLATEAIHQVHRFTDVGDFEGIAVHGGKLFVLRSDGKLFTLDASTGAQIGEQQLRLPALNYEGLCAQPDGSLLLVAKEAAVVGDPDLRPVHRIRDGKVEPYKMLDVGEVARRFAKDFPALATGGLRFSPSAAAVDPASGKLFVLSASDRLLAIYGDALERVLPLPAADHYKPEGLAFLPNGDLLISNEGDKKGLYPPVILRYHRKGY
jgi:hypothetical protein